jgi:hypothetical protein
MAQRTTVVNLDDDEQPKLNRQRIKTEFFGNPSPHSHSMFITPYSSPSLMLAEADDNGGD